MEKITAAQRMIKGLDQSAMAQAQKRLDNLTKPLGSLGRLEEAAKKVVGITGTLKPSLAKKVILTIAGDHGVAAENVSAFPQAVTAQMVYNFLQGGAGINVLARHIGAKVVVLDAGVASDLTPHPDLLIRKIGYGTRNMAQGPAMSREEAVRSIEAGMEAAFLQIDEGANILAAGDMGIANTTPSSAIVSVITGSPVEKVTGLGTGIDGNGLRHKIDVIQKAIAVNRPAPHDALDVLGKVGGFEIGAIAGVFLAGAARGVPAVIDGFISGAGALVACTLEPKVKEYLFASHCSVEQGHAITLAHLRLEPLLDMHMRLGEGTGAALGIGIIEAGVKILNEMATFGEAGVSEKNDRA